MRIEKISIRNLKFLDDAELMFEKDITLLYGQNGIGKTTFLEAISLIGHLSTMRRIELHAGSTNDPIPEPSLFWKELKAGKIGPIKEGITIPALDQTIVRYNKGDSFHELVCNLQNASQDLDKWFYDFKGERNGSAAIRFEIRLDSSSDLIKFCVYKRREDGLTITQALGRKKCDDLKMNESFAVIWESGDSEQMAAMIERCVQSCIYIISLETLGQRGKQADHYFLKYKPPTTQSAMPITTDAWNSMATSNDSQNGYVFYLNTDLNDFGRMRDVRESVKDLDSDFVQEWIERFGIKLPKGGQQVVATNPKHEVSLRADLELIMNKVIARSSPFTLRRGIREFISFLIPVRIRPAPTDKLLHLQEFYVREDGVLRLRTRRKGHDVAKDVDFLSAGENECFFIFLYLLGTNIANSICLLDEPDLHLSQFSKRPFFENLFAMLKYQNCQVIISTHSGFAYTHPRFTKRFLIRRLTKPKAHFETRFTKKFKFGMAAHYLRTALSVLGIAGGVQVAIFVLMFFALGSFVSDVFQRNAPIHMLWTHYFTSPAIVMASILLYVHCIKNVFRDIRGVLGWKDLE